MTDLIRELQPIADQYKVLFAENRELQQQFDALLRTNHEVQQMLRSMQSEKAAADSRVKELTMVVGQLTAENEAFNQQSSQLTQQNEVQIVLTFAVYALGILLHMYSPVCVCTVQT